jgi:hypothetical protein
MIRRRGGHSHDEHDLEPWQTGEYQAQQEAWRGDVPAQAEREREPQRQHEPLAYRWADLQKAVLQALSGLAVSRDAFWMANQVSELSRRLAALETMVGQLRQERLLAEARDREFEDEFLRLREQYGEPPMVEMPPDFDFSGDMED